jgi:hypothetical protein
LSFKLAFNQILIIIAFASRSFGKDAESYNAFTLFIMVLCLLSIFDFTTSQTISKLIVFTSLIPHLHVKECISNRGHTTDGFKTFVISILSVLFGLLASTFN